MKPAPVVLLLALLAAPAHGHIVASRRACRLACAATVYRCGVNRTHADPPATRELRTCRIMFTWFCRHYFGEDWCVNWWGDDNP